MRINLKLLDSNSSFRKKILQAMIQDLDTIFNKSIPTIKSEIKNIVREALKNEPEYSSLTNGELRYEFGIQDVSVVDTVINILVDSGEITKKTTKFSNVGINGGFRYTMMGINDIDDAINSSAASVTDNLRGYSLPWLRWLLLDGSKPIVKDFEVQLGPNPASRTGFAVMVDSDGDNWGVPPQFAGTATNNWTTRAVSRCDKDIVNLIQKIVMSNI